MIGAITAPSGWRANTLWSGAVLFLVAALVWWRVPADSALARQMLAIFGSLIRSGALVMVITVSAVALMTRTQKPQAVATTGVVAPEIAAAKAERIKAIANDRVIAEMRTAKDGASIALQHNTVRSAERAWPRTRAALLSGHKQFGLAMPPEDERAQLNLECARRYIERVLPYLSSGHIEEAVQEGQEFIDGLR